MRHSKRGEHGSSLINPDNIMMIVSQINSSVPHRRILLGLEILGQRVLIHWCSRTAHPSNSRFNPGQLPGEYDLYESVRPSENLDFSWQWYDREASLTDALLTRA